MISRAIGAERLAAVTPNKTLPEWSVEKALAMCDTYGISEGILSISPGYPALEATIERPLMRVCNDIGATIRRDHPGKFGQFASIPMFDRAEALKEIEYAFDTLKADGIVVFTNYGGTYLGDSSFDEIWQELNRRKAVVFIHPTHPTYELKGQPPESVMEYPFETVRTATSLMFSGATRKFTDIKFILSHAGGALPYLAARISGGAMFSPEVSKRVPDVMVEIRKFWFDLALSSNPAALAALFTVADPQRIVFGSDFPYAPDIGIITQLLFRSGSKQPQAALGRCATFAPRSRTGFTASILNSRLNLRRSIFVLQFQKHLNLVSMKPAAAKTVRPDALETIPIRNPETALS